MSTRDGFSGSTGAGWTRPASNGRLRKAHQPQPFIARTSWVAHLAAILSKLRGSPRLEQEHGDTDEHGRLFFVAHPGNERVIARRCRISLLRTPLSYLLAKKSRLHGG